MHWFIALSSSTSEFWKILEWETEPGLTDLAILPPCTYI